MVPGASDRILRCLEAYGLHWDGSPMFQSERLEAYRDAMDRLRATGAVYPCGCSRSALETLADGSRRYPGICRDGLADGLAARSERVNTAAVEVQLTDRVQGDYRQDLERRGGDFVVLRADGLHAYHLATVVDDAAQRVTQVVRGADLLPSTPSQVYLQRLLGLPSPDYCHLPVAVDRNGLKLSKQQGAPPLDPDRPAGPLTAALRLLGQRPPAGLERETPATIWAWAIAHWDLERVPPSPQPAPQPASPETRQQ